MSDEEKEIRRLLEIFFKERPEKVKIWLNTRNPWFGGNAPSALIRQGRAHKVLAFVKSAIMENER